MAIRTSIMKRYPGSIVLASLGVVLTVLGIALGINAPTETILFVCGLCVVSAALSVASVEGSWL